MSTQISPARNRRMMLERAPSERDEWRTATREVPPAGSGMSYLSAAWSAVARSIVWVKTRKGGRSAGPAARADAGCKSWRRARSFPGSVAVYINLCVMLGTAESFRPTTRRTSGRERVSFRSEWARICSRARLSTLDAIVADQNETPSLVLVQADQMLSV